jgi:pimeloyl-ACP methyl ester carboxylesterase
MDWKRVRRWVRLVWVTLGLGLTAWMVWNMQARNVSASLLVASERVQVHTDDDATMFFPAGVPEDAAGLIFLPGGGVDPAAYLPVVRRLADAGLHAALVRLPYRVAPTEASRNEVWRRIIRVRVRWGGKRPVVLAGHSRGGALAARFADQHAMELDGLALVATTHPRDQDLSRVRFPVVKIMGTEDCVAPLDDARGNSGRLPAHTQWVEIVGGNHAQFGYYGSQINDCRAAISREEQQAQLHAALVAMLARIAARTGTSPVR